MKKVSLLVGSLIVMAMLTGCMAFDHTTDHYVDDHSSHGGHSSHH